MGIPLPLAIAAFKRSNLPESITLNVVAEKDPATGNPVLMARPGLEAFETVGSTPLRGISAKAGLFADSAIVLASTTPYTLTRGGVATAFTGSVPGTGLVDMALGQDADLNSVCRIATGTKLYKLLDDLSVTDETADLGDGGGASSIAFGPGQIWAAIESGTDKVYTLSPGAATWDALEFVSAEYQPDPAVAIRTFGELFLILNSTSTEGWAPSASGTPAIEPYGGLKFDYGCRARASAVSLPGSIIWVDNNCQVRMFEGGEPRIISDNGLAEQIRQVDGMDLKGSWFNKDGHFYYDLTLGSTATWRYDLTGSNWTRISSDGYSYSRVSLFANIGEDVLGADSASNQIWRVDPDANTDGSSTFTCEFMAVAGAELAGTPISNLRLHCAVGGSPRTGQGSDPIIRLRMSKDGGKTYGRWFDRGLGATGEWTTRVQWNALGRIGEKGTIFHFQCSDPVSRRFSGVELNATAA